MKPLSLQTLEELPHSDGLFVPDKNLPGLPEKVLQFGTGVLLRGLPDYFIDKANKQGMYNGHVVMVKSTAQGGTDAYTSQDSLYTHCIRGVQNNNKVEEDIINASISRVLSAKDEWNEILKCAANPAMELIVSNTTEVGITLVVDDRIDAAPPISFPGKLLAFLYTRFQVFKGDPAKGMIIIPTELIVNNGDKLQSIVLELAHLNSVDPAFIAWLQGSIHFCNSLVDRIVPGKLPAADKLQFEERYNYNDELMIMSEPYSLWAIETSDAAVKEKLSFYKADRGVVIAPNINKFRELKLRLLNGTHTFSSGLAHLAGCVTVKQAMNNELVSGYIRQLMLTEIAPAIASEEITLDEANGFAQTVIDRFSNPYIEHRWLSITVQYSSKMKLRNVPLILYHYETNDSVPRLMALGFAAYILFMTCTESEGKYTGEANGTTYEIIDDFAHWFAEKCNQVKGARLVQAVLSNKAFWGTDLTNLPNFETAIAQNLELLQSIGALQRLRDLVGETAVILTDR